jgi:hypothetical protein
MSLKRKPLLTQILLLLLTISSIRTDTTEVRKSEKKKYKPHSSKSKLNIDKGNPWPFLPSPGSHYSATKGYPSYPFMIVSPPGKKLKNLYLRVEMLLDLG